MTLLQSILKDFTNMQVKCFQGTLSLHLVSHYGFLHIEKSQNEISILIVIHFKVFFCKTVRMLEHALTLRFCISLKFIYVESFWKPEDGFDLSVVVDCRRTAAVASDLVYKENYSSPYIHTR